MGPTRALARLPNVEMLLRTTAFGYYDGNLVGAVERVTDHLPVALEYASTQPAEAARAFLAEIAHILNVIFNALQKRGSRYASVPGALLELAGEKARAVTVPDFAAVATLCASGTNFSMRLAYST